MKKSFQRVIAMLLAVASVGWISGVDSAQAAGFMKNASAIMSNPQAGGTGTVKVAFNIATSSVSKPIKKILLNWGTDSTATAAPTGTFSSAGTSANDYTAKMDQASSTWAAAGNANGVTMTAATALSSAVSGDTLGFTLNGITNPGISAAGVSAQGCPAAVGDASNTEGTCYILIQTVDASDAVIDQATVGITVTTPVQVKARVESQLNFWVTGTTTAENVPGLTTTTYSANSTYNTVDFGAITPSSSAVEGNANNKSKYEGHKLYVKTNASNGYDVTASLNGSSVPANAQLDGTYNGNKIGGSGHLWGSPAAWAMPQDAGSPHAFFAAHTNDNAITGFGAAAKVWGDLMPDGTSKVKTKTTTDDGTTPTIVSYGIIADVQQPADQYSGTITYNCVGKY